MDLPQAPSLKRRRSSAVQCTYGVANVAGELRHLKLAMFHDLWEKNILTDLEIRVPINDPSEQNNIVCQDAFISIHVHRVVVAACSPYFRAMLGGRSQQLDWKEQEQDVIVLKDVKPCALQALVRFFYTERLEIDANSALATLHAADLLQVTSAKDACCIWLLEHLSSSTIAAVHSAAEMYHCSGLLIACHRWIPQHLNVDNAISFLLLSKQWKDITLKRSVLHFVEQNFVIISNSSTFYNLSKLELVNLCCRDTLCVDSEMHVLRAVAHWSKDSQSRKNRNNYHTKGNPIDNRKGVLGQLCASGVIRLGLLTGDELAIAIQMPIVRKDKRAYTAIRLACCRQAAFRLMSGPNPSSAIAKRSGMLFEPLKVVYKLCGFNFSGCMTTMKGCLIMTAGTRKPDSTILKRQQHYEAVLARRARLGLDETITYGVAPGFDGFGGEIQLHGFRSNGETSINNRTINGNILGCGASDIVKYPSNVVVVLTDHRTMEDCSPQWKVERVLRGHQGDVLSLAHFEQMQHFNSQYTNQFSNPFINTTTNVLVTGSSDGCIKIWNPGNDWCCNTSFAAHDRGVSCLLAIGNKIISGGCDGLVKIWHQKSNVSRSMSKNCEMDDTSDWSLKQILRGHSGRISCLLFARGKLISGSRDTDIRIWSCIHRSGARWNNNAMYVINEEQDGITQHITGISEHILGGHEHAILQLLNVPNSINDVSCGDCTSADINQFDFISVCINSIRIWNIKSMQCLCVLRSRSLCISSIVTSIQNSNRSNTLNTNISLGSSTERRTITVDYFRAAIFMSNKLITGHDDGCIHLWKANKENNRLGCKWIVINSLNSHSAAVSSFFILGGRLVSGDCNGRVNIWGESNHVKHAMWVRKQKSIMQKWKIFLQNEEHEILQKKKNEGDFNRDEKEEYKIKDDGYLKVGNSIQHFGYTANTNIGTNYNDFQSNDNMILFRCVSAPPGL